MSSARIIPSAEPNFTPMIDVLLVLLIVFMLAVVQVHRTMDVQLPQPCGNPCDAPGDAIVLEILPGPSYRLNGSEVKPDELRDHLTKVRERLTEAGMSRLQSIMDQSSYATHC